MCVKERGSVSVRAKETKAEIERKEKNDRMRAILTHLCVCIFGRQREERVCAWECLVGVFILVGVFSGSV